MRTAATEKQPFDQFVHSLRAADDEMNISPTRLAEAMGLTVKNLASIAGVHRNTISTLENSPKLQEALVDMIRVLSAATQLNGNVSNAIFWFRNIPIAEFDHLTPMQLVERGEAQAVIDYVQSLESGSVG